MDRRSFIISSGAGLPTLGVPAVSSARWSDIAKLNADVTIHQDATTTAYSRMIFGGFLEHFGRQIYGGVFDPG